MITIGKTLSLTGVGTTVTRLARATRCTVCWSVMALCIVLTRGALADEQSLTRMIDVVEAPDTALISLQGDDYRISQWRGRVVVVNFWATWCAPCIKELPSLQQLQDDLEDQGVKVVAINPLESLQEIAPYLQEWKTAPTMDMVVDTTHEASLKDWRVRVFPTTYVIDKKGQVAFRAQGERDFSAATIREQIQTLLN